LLTNSPKALAHAMNVGLDSYLDTRLALLLYRNVYSNKGGVELERLASLLLSALAANPHNVEAWDVLFAHFRATTLTSKVLLNEAYRVFKPVASLYPSTYEALLGAIATNFVCDASAGAGGVLPWLLSEIEQTAEACETPMRVALKIAILPCLQAPTIPTMATLLTMAQDHHPSCRACRGPTPTSTR